jgi:hypothetical protein
MLEESDSEEDEPASAMMLLSVIRNEPPPRFNDYIERIVPGYIDREFRENFRMPRAAFEKLLAIVDHKLGKPKTKPFCSTERCLLGSIWVLANKDTFRYMFYC